MFDILTIAFIVLGFAVIWFVAKVGAGSTGSAQGILAFTPMPARPRGTQETDLPPFRFRDSAPGGGPATSGSVAAGRSFEAKAA